MRKYSIEEAFKAMEEWQRKGTESQHFKDWFKGSKVVDEQGEPLVVYHGTSSGVFKINGTFWGFVEVGGANEYAEMRQDIDGMSAVMPVYFNIQKPFDADSLDILANAEYPNGLSVKRFVQQIIEQSGVKAEKKQAIIDLYPVIRSAARREESGPTYSEKDFWYCPAMCFGKDGASAIKKVFEIAGFDGIKFTEKGYLSYGAFSAGQIKSATGNIGTFDPNSFDITDRDLYLKHINMFKEQNLDLAEKNFAEPSFSLSP